MTAGPLEAGGRGIDAAGIDARAPAPAALLSPGLSD